MQVAIAAAVMIAICAILFSERAVAQTTCPNPGEHPATAADVPLMQEAGIPDAAIGVCWNPNSPATGAAAAEAKQDLSGMWCGGKAAQCSYNGSTYTSSIDQLDPKFAACADTFMKQLRQMSPGACINSAYRSTAQQQCTCASVCPDHNPNGCSGKCAPPGESYHQKGLAIDVSHPGLSDQQVWDLASKNGLINPSGLHSSDPNHIQAGSLNCSDSGFTPNDTDVFTPAAQTTTQPPANNVGNTISRMFAPPQSATPYAQPAPIAPVNTTPTTGACSPQYICSNGTVYYQSASCTTSTFQVCQYGCAGTVCATAPANGTTSQAAQNPTITASPLGLLQQFISPATTTSTSTATSAPVSLNSNIYTIVQGELGSRSQSTSSASSSFEGTSGYVQQTFTGNPSSTAYSNAGYSPLMSLFINLRTTLSNLLTYLQPFGGQLPVQQSVE